MPEISWTQMRRTDDDWSNELHPTRHGFEKAAGVLREHLHELMPAKF